MKIVIVILLLAIPLPLQAALYTECNGNPVEWGGDEMVLKPLPISFPEGSAQLRDLETVVGVVNSLPGVGIHIRLAADNDDTISGPSPIGGDGSEVAFVDPESLEDALGKASARRNVYCTPGGAAVHIQECDIRFRTQPYEEHAWYFGKPSAREKWPGEDDGVSFQAIALHEILHCLGLKHEDVGITNMEPTYANGGWYDRPEQAVLPHGDDYWILREILYPEATDDRPDHAPLNFWKPVEVLATPFGNIVLDSNRSKLVEGVRGSPELGGGDVFSVEYNFGNLGTKAEIFRMCFFLSEDTQFDTEDQLRVMDCDWWYSGFGLNSYGFFPLQKYLSVPPYAANMISRTTSYRVIVCADPFDAVEEIREDNNCTALPGSVTVFPPPEYGTTAD